MTLSPRTEMAPSALLGLAAGALLACSGSDAAPPRPRAETQDVRPLTGVDAGAAELVAFVDEATGFETRDVHDATREVVRFDAALAAMVSLDGSAAISGWTATGNELRWSASRIPFRVSFGTEQGERRAFFTEAATGTICDLRLYGPDQLGISGTSEYPPNP